MNQAISSLRTWARPLLAIAVITLLGAIVLTARESLGPYLLGILLAYLLLPVVRRVEQWMPDSGRLAGISRPVAAIAVFFVSMILFLLLLGTLLRPVLDETSELLLNLNTYWDELKLENSGFREWYEEEVPEELQEVIERNIADVGQALVAGIAGLARWVFGTTGSLLGAAIALFAVPLFVIYYLIEEKQTIAVFKRQLPPSWVEDASALFRIFDRILGGYTRGVVVEAALVGVITGAGYWLIGVELALPLGVIAFAGEIVPILGPWIAFAISFPVVLATQPELAIPAVLLFGVIQFLEGWILSPKIQGDSVEFTSAGTLLILAIGGALAGALGVVFALPAAAIIRAVIVYTARRLDGDSPELALLSLRPIQGNRPVSSREDQVENTSEMRLPG